MSHTPGPWKFIVTGDGWDGKTCVLIGADEKYVLSGWGYDASGLHFKQAENVDISVEEEAALPDARLIAAAPDLLEALKQADDILPDCDNPHVEEVLAVVRAAIAKAEGR